MQISDAFELILWSSFLLVIMWIGKRVVKKVRNQALASSHLSADELLDKFRDSYADGELTKEEYETIRDRLEQEKRRERIEDALESLEKVKKTR